MSTKAQAQNNQDSQAISPRLELPTFSNLKLDGSRNETWRYLRQKRQRLQMRLWLDQALTLIGLVLILALPVQILLNFLPLPMAQFTYLQAVGALTLLVIFAAFWRFVNRR